MPAYAYQARVKRLLHAGRSVILQAPTGAGKTRAALDPFIEGFFDQQADQFPRKCIYSVPMRVLANQFSQEYADLAARYARRFDRRIDVRIQTGESSCDPQFEANLIFATIDQSLSSALGVPYSVGGRKANLNAGAVYASYLVFDEFHLFPQGDGASVEGALTTTLQLLMRLKEYVPFVLMTATFSSTMLVRLAQLLDAEVVQVPPEEYRKIAADENGQVRQRTFTLHEDVINAEAVLATHQQRSIAICNQVARAQELYKNLRQLTQDSDIEVILLHSRFTQADRAAKEDEVRALFGKGYDRSRSAILVATQVIEVGLNITCEHLHTELAPANAILQRAGRCARYPGEQGTVHVYRVPEREQRGRKGEDADTQDADAAVTFRPDYLPYPAVLCEQTWASLLARHGHVIDVEEEQRIIDEVHTEQDGQLLDAMQRQSDRLWSQIQRALETSDSSARGELIRRVNSVKVLAATTPDDLGNPFTADGFSFYRGSVYSLLNQIQTFDDPPGGPLDNPAWRMALPTLVEPESDHPTELPSIKWTCIEDKTLLQTTPVVAINAAYCRYDAELGFRIVPPGTEGTPHCSLPGEFSSGNRRSGYTYQLESYTEHIARMLAVYEERFSSDYAYIERRMAERNLIAPRGLMQAIRLAIACHDLAKLDVRWQKWVRAYQEAIDEPLPSKDYMAVHTHWDPKRPDHQAAKQIANRAASRPNHAGESAVAAGRLVAGLYKQPYTELGRAVLTAIARHHSPQTSQFDDYQLHPAAGRALAEALQVAGIKVAGLQPVPKMTGGSLENLLIRPAAEQYLLYLLIVRMLRLCDGLSQER